MPVVNEKFDQFKVDRLKSYLEDMAEKGQAKEYEIFVDTLKIVPRTDDPVAFDNYERYITEDTEKVKIVFYNSAQTNRNDQYCFYFQNKHKKESGLGEIDTIIQEKLQARDREFEIRLLQKELDETKEKLKESEEYTDLLKEQLEQEKISQTHKKMGLVDFGAAVLEGLVRHNPQWLGKMPFVGNALAGFIEQDNLEKRQLPSNASPETNASFQKKTNDQQQVNPEQLQYLAIMQYIEATFEQPQLDILMQVLARFAEDHNNLLTVAELFHIQTK